MSNLRKELADKIRFIRNNYQVAYYPNVAPTMYHFVTHRQTVEREIHREYNSLCITPEILKLLSDHISKNVEIQFIEEPQAWDDPSICFATIVVYEKENDDQYAYRVDEHYQHIKMLNDPEYKEYLRLSKLFAPNSLHVG